MKEYQSPVYKIIAVPVEKVVANNYNPNVVAPPEMYHYYNVKEYGNGCIILEPRELSVPKSISARTLADMDHAVSNFKCGDVSTAIDLSDL